MGEGGGISSWTEDSGVCRSQEVTPVRLRLDGGMWDPVGDWARLSCLMDSWSDSSAKPTEERGDPSREVIVMGFL